MHQNRFSPTCSGAKVQMLGLEASAVQGLDWADMATILGSAFLSVRLTDCTSTLEPALALIWLYFVHLRGLSTFELYTDYESRSP